MDFTARFVPVFVQKDRQCQTATSQSFLHFFPHKFIKRNEAFQRVAHMTEGTTVNAHFTAFVTALLAHEEDESSPLEMAVGKQPAKTHDMTDLWVNPRHDVCDLFASCDCKQTHSYFAHVLDSHRKL